LLLRGALLHGALPRAVLLCIALPRSGLPYGSLLRDTLLLLLRGAFLCALSY